MLQFTQLFDRALSGGINQHHFPDSLPEGFSEDIVNMDVDNDALNLRNGYTRFAGDIPLRVEKAIYSTVGGNKYLDILFNSFVDLTSVPAGTPAYIQGQFTGADGNTYSAGNLNGGYRYSSFSKVDAISLPATAEGVTETVTINRDRSLISSENSLFHLYIPSNLDIMYPDMAIDFGSGATRYDISVTYNSPVDLTAYLATIAFPAAFSYVQADVIASEVNIPAGTHNLPSSAIFPQIYLVDGDLRRLIYPEDVKISSAGDVTLYFASGIGSAIEIFLFAGDTSNKIDASSGPANEYLDIEIPNAETPHLFPVIYQTDINTGDIWRVLPESITFSEEDNSHSISLHTAGDSFVFTVYYLYGERVNRRIRFNVTASENTGDTHFSQIGTGVSGTSLVTLAVNGISQDLLPSKSNIYHINGYLGSVAAVASAEGFLYRDFHWNVSEYADTRVRTSGTQVIGPLFTSEIPLLGYRRTGGFIVSSSATAGGFAYVTGISYAGGNVTYRLSLPDGFTCLKDDLTPELIGNLIIAGRSKLTVSGILVDPGFNGTFEVVSISAASTYIDVTCANPNIARDIWNGLQVYGLAGIFTDSLALTGTLQTFGTGVNTISISETSEVIVDEVDGSTAYVSSVMETSIVPLGLKLGCNATCASFPLATSHIVNADCVKVDGRSNRVISMESGIVSLRDEIEITTGIIQIDLTERWQIILPNSAFTGSSVVTEDTYLHSVNASGSLYFSEGSKYDGDKIYLNGIPNIQPQIAASVVDGTGIALYNTVEDMQGAAAAGSKVLTFTAGKPQNSFPDGSSIVLRKKSGSNYLVDTSDDYTVVTTDDSDLTINLDRGIKFALSAGDQLSTYRDFAYFVRLALTDRNGNTIVGRSSGEGDFRFRLSGTAATVYIKVFIPVNSTNINLDYDRLSVELFRRTDYLSLELSKAPKFYKILTKQLSKYNFTGDGGCYVEFIDNVPLEIDATSNVDTVPNATFGSFGDLRERPIYAKFSTTFNNQLALANLTGENKVRLNFQGSLAVSDLANKYMLIQGMKFKFLNSPVTPSAATLSSGIGTITAAGTYLIGRWVYIAHAAGTDDLVDIRQSTALSGWHKISEGGVGSFKVDIPDIDISVAPVPASLRIFYDPSESVIPLAADPKYHNLIYSAANSDYVTISLPGHLAAAATTALFNLYGITSRGGSNYSSGYIEFAGDNLTSIDVSNIYNLPGLHLFANGDAVTASSAGSISPVRRAYPSRVILSQPGYPEVFESVEVDVGVSSSPLVQDVNPDDGDEITAILPFFGSSVFGAAMQSMVLVIFKPHGIFVLDSQAKLAGKSDYLQKLETRGLGCEAGFSVTNSADGIIFANSSGIYLLNRNLQVVYIGKYLEKLWINKVDVSSACISNYPIQRKLRLSVTRLSDNVRVTFNLKLLDNMIDEVGVASGWTRYEGIDAYQWSSREMDTTLFASSGGYVGIILNNGDIYDHADDGEAISASLTCRAMSFEAPAVQKSVRYVTVYSSNEVTIPKADIQCYMYYDLKTEVDTLDRATLRGSTNLVQTGFGDLLPFKMNSVSYSPGKAKATWYQFKWTYEGIYKPISITRVAYTVAILRTRGNVAAAKT